MTSLSIVTPLQYLAQVSRQSWQALWQHRTCFVRPALPRLAQFPAARLPQFVRESAVALRYLRLLGPLAWERFPERDLATEWGHPPIPYTAFVAACLVKLDQQLPYMAHLRRYLVEHPALVWLLGFPLVPSWRFPWGFDVEASLPTARHFTRMLRQIPNASLQWLLDETVRLLQAELSSEVDDFGQAVSLDTKHILAWVRENNPKEYIKRRYVKEQQPAGDPDCRLGCKRRSNQSRGRASSATPPATPTDNPVPAGSIAVAEYHWGYASGVVATKVPDWGEFVLAELTLPFDQPDVAYFYPLLADTERRLGFRPRYCALDAAFDAYYIYEYFYQPDQPLEDGFAAVPLSKRGGPPRSFSPLGLPLCQAQLPMPLKYTFTCKTTLFEHERGRYVCPLRYPHLSAEACPVGHKNWAKGGCISTMPTCIGARLRYQLDRDSARYKEIYAQRTATERINSLALELGIERPKLRNGQAIAHQNTLIYVLLNLRALQRVRDKKQNCLQTPSAAS